jgi:hypothetical protein
VIVLAAITIISVWLAAETCRAQLDDSDQSACLLRVFDSERGFALVQGDFIESGSDAPPSPSRCGWPRNSPHDRLAPLKILAIHANRRVHQRRWRLRRCAPASLIRSKSSLGVVMGVDEPRWELAHATIISRQTRKRQRDSGAWIDRVFSRSNGDFFKVNTTISGPPRRTANSKWTLGPPRRCHRRRPCSVSPGAVPPPQPAPLSMTMSIASIAQHDFCRFDPLHGNFTIRFGHGYTMV